MSKGPQPIAKPHFLESLSADDLVAVILRLGMEISVLRERLATQEALLVQAGVLSPDAIDDYNPSGTEEASRRQAREDWVQQILTDLGGGKLEAS